MKWLTNLFRRIPFNAFSAIVFIFFKGKSYENCFLCIFPFFFIDVKCFQKLFPQKSRLCFQLIFMTLIIELCPWQEEVEIEAKVVADKEILTSVVVEVRKKDNGELIALGKQWMATPTLKVKLGEMSKLWAQTNETQNAFWFFFWMNRMHFGFSSTNQYNEFIHLKNTGVCQN